MGVGMFRGFGSKLAALRLLHSQANQAVKNNQHVKDEKKSLTAKEVEEIRSKGGTVVYHYRETKERDSLILTDWHGRRYLKNKKGVISRIIPKVNGKVAKKQRRQERLAAQG